MNSTRRDSRISSITLIDAGGRADTLISVAGRTVPKFSRRKSHHHESFAATNRQARAARDHLRDDSQHPHLPVEGIGEEARGKKSNFAAGVAW